MVRFNNIHFHQLGMQMIKKCHHQVDLNSTTDDRAFRSIFGVSWNVVANAWNLLEIHNGEHKKTSTHLLWALLFIKQYGNEQGHCMMVGGGVSLKTFRKWIWVVLDELAAVSAVKVRHIYCSKFFDYLPTNNFPLFSSLDCMGKQKKGDIQNDCLVSVDCTNCRISEPYPYKKVWLNRWFSPKGGFAV